MRTIILRNAGQFLTGMGLVLSISVWFPASSFGDTITFKTEGAQSGTVLEENEQSVTVRFPKGAIQSVVKTQPLSPITQKSDQQLLEKLDQLQERLERLERMQKNSGTTTPSAPLPSPEKKQASAIEAKTSSLPELPKKPSLQEQLQQEELGQVQGVILWRGRPMSNGRVRIELDKYTGVSLAATKKRLAESKRNVSENSQGISLETQTDSQGRYAFDKIPPGTYWLYWWPDFKTGWIRRLRDKPDFEVLSGKRTIQNIPERPTDIKTSEKKP